MRLGGNRSSVLSWEISPFIGIVRTTEGHFSKSNSLYGFNRFKWIVRAEPVEARSSYSLREGYAHAKLRTNGKTFKMRIAVSARTVATFITVSFPPSRSLAGETDRCA